MMTFLERYQNGECKQVWTELIALGAKVREEPVYSDARAVAYETMHRVRANVEMIYQRLNTLGYVFEYPDAAFTSPQPDVVQQLDEFERQVGPIPLSLRAWCEIVGEVNFIGNYRGLSYYGRTVSDGEVQVVESDFTNFDILSQEQANWTRNRSTPSKKLQGLLQDTMKQLYSKNPDMVDLLKRRVESDKQRPSWKVHQNKDVPFVDSDPLVVEILYDLSLEAYKAWQEDVGREGEPFRISIAPDIVHKTNTSGGAPYDIALPDPSADALVLNEWHDTTFVSYLRIVFEWGGFPGLEDDKNAPQDLLKMLKEELLPI